MSTPVISLILAAGLGTRMRSERAKVLHRVGGRTLVEWVISALSDAGVERHIVVVGHQADEVRALCAAPGVGFALQSEQKGTGHAAQCARDELPSGDELVLVTVGDAPLVLPETYRAMLDHHRAHDADATILTAFPPDPTGYGRVIRDESGRVQRIVEQRDATEAERAVGEVNSGIYALRASKLQGSLDRLRADNDQGELYLTDTVAAIADDDGTVRAIAADDPDELMGINTRAQMAEAGRVLIGRKLEALMTAGVTIELPSATWIEPTVQIGRDTIIAPFAHLSGGTEIGSGCRIGTGAILHDAKIENGLSVPPGERILGSAR
ncbi:MAG: hypothetical protein CME06_02550 [Gemmatimonadetes bacterium]|nr:hypothetical protein [Gemmatimonadota bacterium]